MGRAYLLFQRYRAWPWSHRGSVAMGWQGMRWNPGPLSGKRSRIVVERWQIPCLSPVETARRDQRAHAYAEQNHEYRKSSSEPYSPSSRLEGYPKLITTGGTRWQNPEHEHNDQQDFSPEHAASPAQQPVATLAAARVGKEEEPATAA